CALGSTVMRVNPAHSTARNASTASMLFRYQTPIVPDRPVSSRSLPANLSTRSTIAAPLIQRRVNSYRIGRSPCDSNARLVSSADRIARPFALRADLATLHGEPWLRQERSEVPRRRTHDRVARVIQGLARRLECLLRGQV